MTAPGEMSDAEARRARHDEIGEQFKRTLIAIVVTVVLVVIVNDIIVGSIRLRQSTRSDQNQASIATGRVVPPFLRHLAVLTADSAALGPVALPTGTSPVDGSTVSLALGSRLSALTPAVGFQRPNHYVTLTGTGTFALRSEWVVTTALGTVRLEPGRYVIRGSDSDTGMLVSVLVGSAEAWPLYGMELDQVHVPAGFSVWLPRVGAVPPLTPLTPLVPGAAGGAGGGR